MNRLFQAWVETAYHWAVHSETGRRPPPAGRRPRRKSGPSPSPPCCGRRCCSERRKADKTGLVSLHGNVYQVDAGRPGGSPGCRSFRSTWTGSRSASREASRDRRPVVMGVTATPRPAPRTGSPQRALTGIDYLGALGDGHDEARRAAPTSSPSGAGEPKKKEEPKRSGKSGRKAATDSPGQTLARPAPRPGRSAPERRHPRRAGLESLRRRGAYR